MAPAALADRPPPPPTAPRESFAPLWLPHVVCCSFLSQLRPLRVHLPAPISPPGRPSAMRPPVPLFVSSPRHSSPRDASCRLSISPAHRAPRRFVIRLPLGAFTSTCSPPAPLPPRPRVATDRRPPFRASPSPLPSSPALPWRRRLTRRPVAQRRAHHYPLAPLRCRMRASRRSGCRWWPRASSLLPPHQYSHVAQHARRALVFVVHCSVCPSAPRHRALVAVANARRHQ